MAYSSPAVLSYAMGLVKALFTPARGRHAVAARRRRSTRVRRYAPLPAPVPAQASAPPAPRPAPRLAPPREHLPAEDVALVRGYYRAFETERDLARVQAEARARLDRWAAKPAAVRIPAPRPAGDLLAPVDDLGDLRDATRRRLDQQHRKAVA
ncbi:hypothetical protein DFP74_3244 [Nocardiopsis sp. Huas11]|uniref:hypothetical protein n=1 Tax=Nocardiopsis sp. Huas11 TaxID=2183912 RepID=UPI000F0EBFDE|nr:hypothetical protein [Nocardiopsis sp. Huas11]RKS07567.1 hypothetical protein DFP74_3244 [Nocardiopsis sp. Huas11]